jgi:hypothetical protein
MLPKIQNPSLIMSKYTNLKWEMFYRECNTLQNCHCHEKQGKTEKLSQIIGGKENLIDQCNSTGMRDINGETGRLQIQ